MGRCRTKEQSERSPRCGSTPTAGADDGRKSINVPCWVGGHLDIYSIGSSEVQVSGPRGPCWKQERKLRLPGFLKRTIESLRTGFYLQVLQCGTVQAGDTWHLKSRPNAWLTLHAVNVCYYQIPGPEMVERILATPELAEGWKRMFGEKVSPK